MAGNHLSVVCGDCRSVAVPLPELPATPGKDKTHHLIAYGALMIPTALRRPKHWIGLGLLYIALSGAIELIQPLANRHMEAADLLANSLGVLIGTVLGRGADKLLSGNA